MAGGFVTALSLVPWGTLLDRAPAIYEAASKLVLNLRRSREELSEEVAAAGSEAPTVRHLAARVEELERSLLILNAQLGEAGALIRELAETNRALARRTLFLRHCLVAAAVVAALALLLAAIALYRP